MKLVILGEREIKLLNNFIIYNGIKFEFQESYNQDVDCGIIIVSKDTTSEKINYYKNLLKEIPYVIVYNEEEIFNPIEKLFEELFI